MIPTSYDTIVIGTGIAGVSTAHSLQELGESVLLLDRSGTVASGGSGAAGAFISPKIGRGSPLQKLTNEAFAYARDFYSSNFPQHFQQSGVIRIPKDRQDANKFHDYEEFNSPNYSWINAQKLHSLGINEDLDSFLFPDAGFCDAPAICEALSTRIHKESIDVKTLRYEDGIWIVSSSNQENSYTARNIVLATGYQNDLLDMRYMGVRGTWGSRGDFYSDIEFHVSMHKSLSISANSADVIKIGATHVKSQMPCLMCEGKPLDPLLEKASALIDTDRLTLKETYCGMRAGSKDYFPLVGSVIDTAYMLENYPAITRGANPPLHHHKNLYICNGLGGRGFVFGPLMGKMLAEHIVNRVEIDKRVNPDRLFLKWCRKSINI